MSSASSSTAATVASGNGGGGVAANNPNAGTTTTASPASVASVGQYTMNNGETAILPDGSTMPMAQLKQMLGTQLEYYFSR